MGTAQQEMAMTAAGSSAAFKLGLIGWLLAVVLALTGGALAWRNAHAVSVGLRGQGASNVWFESDVQRVHANMLQRNSNQYRSKVHPVFALVAYPACSAIGKLTHLPLDEITNVFLVLTAAVWSAALFVCLFALRLGYVDAALLTLAGLFSSSSYFFFSVPETYGLGSVSVVLAILAAVWGSATRSRAALIAASAFSLSITVTNWVLGLLLTLEWPRWRRWVRITINAFIVITVLWTAERAIMPTADYFTAVTGERGYTVHVSPKRIAQATVSFAFHGMVAPRLIETSSFGGDDVIGPVWTRALSFQAAAPGSASWWGGAAATLWILMVGAGVVAALRGRHGRLGWLLCAFVAFQLLLHIVYGVETFMYALDWLPVLIVLAGFGLRWIGRAGWVVLAAFVIALAINNSAVYGEACNLVRGYEQAHPIASPKSLDDLKFTPCVTRP